MPCDLKLREVPSSSLVWASFSGIHFHPRPLLQSVLIVLLSASRWDHLGAHRATVCFLPERISHSHQQHEFSSILEREESPMSCSLGSIHYWCNVHVHTWVGSWPGLWLSWHFSLDHQIKIPIKFTYYTVDAIQHTQCTTPAVTLGFCSSYHLTSYGMIKVWLIDQLIVFIDDTLAFSVLEQNVALLRFTLLKTLQKQNNI